MRRHGFTLLELLVVLALFAITAAAAIPAFLGDARTRPEMRAANDVAALLTEARRVARESGASATVDFAPVDARYWLTTRDSSYTGQLSLDPTVRMTASDTNRIACRFDAVGTATPCNVNLQGARRVSVVVNRWTGDIRITDGAHD